MKESNDFASYLKELIESSSYSYRELGRLADVSYTYLSKIANGRMGPPSPNVLKRLAPFLNVTYEDLMDAAGYLEKEQLLKDALDSLSKWDEERDIIQGFGKEALANGPTPELVTKMEEFLKDKDPERYFSYLKELKERNIDPKETKKILEQERDKLRNEVEELRSEQKKNKLTCLRLELADILDNDEIELTEGGDPLDPRKRKKLIQAIKDPNSIELTPKPHSLPILGTIKAGIPILSEENYEGELEIPSDMDGDFAVEVSGDSMVGAGINPGDYILCKQSQTAYNKDIVAAVREGEVTLKYFIDSNGQDNNGPPVLRAANPEYKDIPIDEHTRIEGVKTGLIRKESTPYHRYQEYIATKNDNLQDWDKIIEKAAAYGIKPDKLENMLEMLWEMQDKK